MKSEHENISVRYQLRENIATTKLMLPIAAVMVVLAVSGAVLYMTVLPLHRKNDYLESIEQLTVYCLYAEIQV